MLCSCNPAKNNSSTRRYQAFITKYNVHYNGDKYYNETVRDMEEAYEDDFDKLLPIHPADVKGKAGYPQPQGDFTRSMEKAQKAIELHSITKVPRGRARTADERAWKTRGEYNPFIHNSWMLLGKSLYMNGDFKKAVTVFAYIAVKFTWLPETVAEARIWEARCYASMDDKYQAEIVLGNVKINNLKTKESRYAYYLVEASLAIGWGDYEKAIKWLAEAEKLAVGKQKQRLKYLRAQLLAETGDRNAATALFDKISRSMSLDVRTIKSAKAVSMELKTNPNRNKPANLSLLDSLVGIAKERIGLDSINILKEQQVITDSLYRKAYEKYVLNDLTGVHDIINNVLQEYPDNHLMDKFLFLNAVSYGAEGNAELFKSYLKEITERGGKDGNLYALASRLRMKAESGEIPLKSDILPFNRGLSGVSEDRVLEDLDEIEMLALLAEEPSMDEDDESPRIIVVSFSPIEVNANKLLFDIASFNFDTFVAREFDLQLNRNSELCSIIISGFNNRAEADYYLKLLKEEVMLPKEVEIKVELSTN